MEEAWSLPQFLQQLKVNNHLQLYSGLFWVRKNLDKICYAPKGNLANTKSLGPEGIQISTL